MHSNEKHAKIVKRLKNPNDMQERITCNTRKTHTYNMHYIYNIYQISLSLQPGCHHKKFKSSIEK
jgi:hypothetical protein